MGTDPCSFRFWGHRQKQKKHGSVPFSSFSYVSLHNNLIDRMRTKHPRSSGVKSAVDFNKAAGENSQEKESCFAWKDEEVESLIDIFSEETIRRHFVLEELRMPGSSIYSCTSYRSLVPEIGPIPQKYSGNETFETWSLDLFRSDLRLNIIRVNG